MAYGEKSWSMGRWLRRGNKRKEPPRKIKPGTIEVPEKKERAKA